MFFENEDIRKEYKRCVRSVFIGALVLALAALLFLTGVLHAAKARRQIVHLNDVIIQEGSDKYERIAYLDMIGFFQFATYGDDYGYYIAYDDDFFYLIGFKDRDFDYIEKKFDTADYVTVYGYTKPIPEEAKSYAIASLNEEMGEKTVTYNNFYDVFGDTLLEVRRDPGVLGIGSLFELSGVWLIFGLFTALFGSILLIIGLSQKKSFERYSAQTGLLNAELNDETASQRRDMKLILGKDHLFSYNGSLEVIGHNDIAWVYPTRHSTNGISDYNYLNICLKDGKAISCGSRGTFGKKRRTQTEESHTEVMNYLYEKNPQILFGYTPENLEAYKAIRAQAKNGI
ncbi:MAG: hypothetical protein K5648_05460 [Erysipelotrichaceae bacterium]|nr:hypothetical protein [Erysipelotrichaceae bacterium]